MCKIEVFVRKDMYYEFCELAEGLHVKIIECLSSDIAGLLSVCVEGSAISLYLVGRAYARKELLRVFNDLAV